ncbi:hypothetical protein ACFYW8_43455 [Streptomyces sp. NPDC002742]|uniref:hypothetical protein n=1 Tax=Streptomyces sp. NPDC002742 TaxID=3364663 RepID=UPI00367C5453
MEKSATTRFDDAAVALLADMPTWRLRAIERIELSSAFWSERRRDIHVRPLKEVLNEKTKKSRALQRELCKLAPWTQRDGLDTIELILPITELPKIALLDLKITIAERQVTRLSKDEGARIAAQYVIQLAREAELTPEEGEPEYLVDFLTFLFYHPSYSYEETLRKYERLDYPRYLADRDYLCTKESEVPVNVDMANNFATWAKRCSSIAKVAESYVIPDYASGAENPLISLPYFFQELDHRSKREDIDEHLESDATHPKSEEVNKLLEYVCHVVTKAHNEGSPNAAASRFLSAYFAYGYRWMVFVKCTVPLDQPFTITVEDKRAIYFQPERRLNRTETPYNRLVKQHAWHMVAFADAETNHVSVRVTDTSVRLKHRNGWPKILNEKGSGNEILNGKGTGNKSTAKPDEKESTTELFLLQDSTRSRPERIYIESPLGLTRVQAWMLNLTIGITLLAFALLVWRVATDASDVVWIDFPAGHSHGLTSADVTLILVPVAFAASYLLIRDSSTLSMQIRQVRQMILMGALFALLAASFVLMWTHYLKIG